MTHQDDGGPAFPQALAISPSGDVYGSEYFGSGGMSLRDAFAIGAVSGHLASMNPGSIDQRFAEHVAASAYMVADAMLAARATPVSDTGGAA